MPAGGGARAGLVAAIALIAALAGGCTTSGSGKTSPSVSAVTPSTPALSPPLTVAPSTVGPTTPVSAPPSSTVGASHASVPAGPPRSTCADVSVRVIRGSASPGQEIASLQFTNSGTAPCVLNGFPVVTLLRNGNQIGQPSQASTSSRSSMTLAPGQVAESLLHDYTQTCQAALSDSVRVQVPGSTITVERPQMQLRACIVRVDKLGPPQ